MRSKERASKTKRPFFHGLGLALMMVQRILREVLVTTKSSNPALGRRFRKTFPMSSDERAKSDSLVDDSTSLGAYVLMRMIFQFN